MYKKIIICLLYFAVVSVVENLGKAAFYTYFSTTL